MVGILSFGCSSSEEDIFYIAGIPDQNVGELTRQYVQFTEYLSDELVPLRRCWGFGYDLHHIGAHCRCRIWSFEEII